MKKNSRHSTIFVLVHVLELLVIFSNFKHTVSFCHVEVLLPVGALHRSYPVIESSLESYTKLGYPLSVQCFLPFGTYARLYYVDEEEYLRVGNVKHQKCQVFLLFEFAPKKIELLDMLRVWRHKQNAVLFYYRTYHVFPSKDLADSFYYIAVARIRFPLYIVVIEKNNSETYSATIFDPRKGYRFVFQIENYLKPVRNSKLSYSGNLPLHFHPTWQEFVKHQDNFVVKNYNRFSPACSSLRKFLDRKNNCFSPSLVLQIAADKYNLSFVTR